MTSERGKMAAANGKRHRPGAPRLREAARSPAPDPLRSAKRDAPIAKTRRSSPHTSSASFLAPQLRCGLWCRHRAFSTIRQTTATMVKEAFGVSKT